MHSNCRWSRSTNWNLKTTPHLTGRQFRWHPNITSDCTEWVAKKFTQQVSKELEAIRLIWVLSHLYSLSLYSSIKYEIAMEKRTRNSLLSPWASWTFGPGKERARRATCLLPPSLGHSSRKQAGSRLSLGPTFPTGWREPPSEIGGRCILLIKAFSKFPSSPRKEGGGSCRAIVTPGRPGEERWEYSSWDCCCLSGCKIPSYI